MSKQPARPAARRPGGPASGPPSRTASAVSHDVTAEDLRNLPDDDENGSDVDLDPENASSGKMQDETATIGGARFVKVDFQRKDGTYPPDSKPIIQLIVSFKRDQSEEGARMYEEKYKYSDTRFFVISKDGVKVRARKVEEGRNPPRPYKFAPAMLFLASVKNAGGANVIDQINKVGVSALAGLRVHVRKQKIAGMHEDSLPILLVDYIDGMESPGAGAVSGGQSSKPKSAAKPVASSPAAAQVQTTVNAQVQAAVASADSTVQNSEIASLAEAALLDILEETTSKSLAPAQIAGAVIRNATWKAHPNRSAILSLLRQPGFLSSTNAPWKFDGTTVTL